MLPRNHQFGLGHVAAAAVLRAAASQGAASLVDDTGLVLGFSVYRVLCVCRFWFCVRWQTSSFSIRLPRQNVLLWTESMAFAAHREARVWVCACTNAEIRECTLVLAFVHVLGSPQWPSGPSRLAKP